MSTQSLLRGQTPRAGPGARGIAQLGKDECRRHVAMTLACVDVGKLYKEVHGEEPKSLVSDVARGVGDRFERELLDYGAKRLLDLYSKELAGVQTEVLRTGPAKGDSEENLAAAARRTTEMVLSRAKDQAGACLILWSALPLPFGTEATWVRPDYLLGLPGKGLVIGEIKSYLDRSSRTDPHELGSACHQAAVGMVALAELYRTHGIDPALVGNEAHIVMRHSSKVGASLRRMGVAAELDAVRAQLDDVPNIVSQVSDAIDGRPLVEAVTSVPNHWSPDCAALCPFDEQCRPADPARVLLDQEAAQAGIGPGRLAALASGSGPDSPEEADLAEAMAAIDKVIG
ncbi:MAG: hypothetical protein ACRD0J_03275 [Acidimicrobiales bacterium]